MVEKAVDEYNKEIVTDAGGLIGFKGDFLMVDRKSGKLVTITLWETEEDLQSGAAVGQHLRWQAAQSAGASQPATVEIYEVAHHPLYVGYSPFPE